MSSPETVIIGGGVVGASVAYHLAERGAADILVLEREPRQGLGSTGKATGGVRAQFETEINIRLSKHSIDFFREWEHDCGYEPRGYLFFTTKEPHLEYLKANVEKQRQLGIIDVEMVGRQEICEMVPGICADDIIGGTFGSSDGFIDPIAVMEGFTKGAAARGVEFQTGVTVTSIQRRNGPVFGVTTDRGFLECERLVICAGAWSRTIARMAGIDLPIEALRRQIAWARSAEPLPPELPMVIDLDTGFHFRPAKNSSDEVLFAFPDPDEQPSFATDFDPAFLEKVYERAKARAPFLAETKPVLEKCRAGLYENTPDHHAVIGGCEVDGLYFACGFSGHGVMHSPATGRAMAEMILDGQSNFLDVSCLSIERFAKGEMLHETAFI